MSHLTKSELSIDITDNNNCDFDSHPNVLEDFYDDKAALVDRKSRVIFPVAFVIWNAFFFGLTWKFANDKVI